MIYSHLFYTIFIFHTIRNIDANYKFVNKKKIYNYDYLMNNENIWNHGEVPWDNIIEYNHDSNNYFTIIETNETNETKNERNKGTKKESINPKIFWENKFLLSKASFFGFMKIIYKE